MNNELKIVIAGGGTGGHLFPGIALAEYLEKNWRARILFIGASYGIENKILPEMSFEFKKTPMRGLQRKLSFTNLLFPFRLFISLVQCAIIFLREKPNIVVGTGGYVSAPPLMIAILFGIPTLIQEQNSYPGLVNRLLAKHITEMHISFEASRKHFKKQSNLRLSGNPVRQSSAKTEKVSSLKNFKLLEDKITAIVFGGSQGAARINKALLSVIQKIDSSGKLQILWATGSSQFTEISRAMKQYEFVQCHAFINDMTAAYACADFAICRSGATTLAELALAGLPSILIPYPYSAEGHQEKNALSVYSAGAACIIPENELSKEKLLFEINKLTNSADLRMSMSNASKNLAKPEATKTIAESIVRLSGLT